MIRPLRRIGALLIALLFAIPLLVGGGAGSPLSASAQMNCPTPSDGDTYQGPDERIYVYRDGILRAVPDRETLRALGFDLNGVDPIRDECLRSMRIGDPVPSVGTRNSQAQTTASPDPAASRDPAAPAIVLDISDARPARRTTVRLTARADTPQANGLVLSIHRTSNSGQLGASGLVTTCADATICTVEVWEDDAASWIFVATLYRCSAPGVCVAVQESTPVTVTWQ